MPRSVRIEYPGAVYHVMCRGDRREAIFRDAADYQRFLETLGEVCDRTGFRLHAFALLPNHYHLLLETSEANLVAGMKWFQGTYTQRFNRRHGLVGHLFQGRYKAIPVEAAAAGYFRAVSDYIHLNPARAGLLSNRSPRLISYPWSSFPGYVAAQVPWAFLVRHRVLGSHDLPDEGAASRRKYARRMEALTGEVLGARPDAEREAEWAALRRGWYIGGETFRERLMERAAARAQGRKRGSYRSEGLEAHDEREAVRRLTAALKRLGVTLEELRGMRQTHPSKQGVAWIVKSQTTVTDEWLCKRLEMGSRTNVHRAVRAYRQAHDPVRRKLKHKLQLCAD